MDIKEFEKEANKLEENLQEIPATILDREETSYNAAMALGIFMNRERKLLNDVNPLLTLTLESVLEDVKLLNEIIKIIGKHTSDEDILMDTNILIDEFLEDIKEFPKEKQLKLLFILGYELYHMASKGW